ncbi:MAG: hypothetical protein WAN74_04450 [Thermoplasmata archaeon]
MEPAPTARRAPRRPLSKNARIGIGLVLTFLGLVFLVSLLPTGSSALATALPLAAAGILAIWVGGILLGRANAP